MREKERNQPVNTNEVRDLGPLPNLTVSRKEQIQRFTWRCSPNLEHGKLYFGMNIKKSDFNSWLWSLTFSCETLSPKSNSLNSTIYLKMLYRSDFCHGISRLVQHKVSIRHKEWLRIFQHLKKEIRITWVFFFWGGGGVGMKWKGEGWMGVKGCEGGGGWRNEGVKE